MKNGLEVYDYGEEEEVPEVATDKFSAKFKNPNLDDSAALKCEFVECVAQGTTVPKQGIGNVLCVNVDAVECDSGCHNENSFGRPGAGGEDFATQTHSTSCEQLPDFKKDSFGCGSCISEVGSRDSFPEAPIPGKIQLNCGISQSLSNNEPVDVNSDADESMNEDSPTSPASDTMEDDVSLRGQVSDNCIDNLAMDDINMPVVISPDYVVYRGNCCSVSLVIFSCSGIKIEDLAACGKEGTFSFEKQIDDIIDIKCQWFQRIKLAVIKLRVLSEDVKEGDDACGTGGIEELKFSVFEPDWSEKKDKITSLSDKYMALCNIVHEEDVEMEGDSSPGQSHYFHDFDEPFEDVIYPKGDSDAVSISKRDVDLLQPETFVNDTIIDFYIKYLKNQIPPEERHRFHFFNSFFFRKLADLDKDPSSISDGRAAFLRVHKWTRKVDIFGKDYIFIPVNFSLHWSLIVICHPGEVTVFKDENTDKSQKVPCILHMDSMKGTHAGLKNLVQSYLMEEWKVRHKDASEDLSSKFLTLRFMQLELPQQENLFDCGLFLLHYLELFLAEAPVNFSPFRLTKSSNFLNGDWFLASEASLKRTLIEKLIFELLQNRSLELNSIVCDNGHQSSGVPENNQNEMAVEFLSQNCCDPIAQHEINSQGSQGIEITLLAEASMRNMQCVNASGLVLREFFEPGASAGSLLPQYQSFGQSSSNYHINGTISTREQEGGITDEGFVYLPSGENGFQQMSGLTPQAGTISYSRDYATEAPWNAEISMQGEHNADSSPEASYCASDDSEDVGIIEHNPFTQEVSQGFKERTTQQRSPSVDNIACITDSLPGLKENATEKRSSSIDNIASLTDPHEEDDSQGLNKNTTQQISLSMDNMACLTNPLVEDDSQGLKENTTQQRSVSLDPVACLTNPLAEDDSQGPKEDTTQRRSPLMDNNVCLTDPHVEDDSQGLKENDTEDPVSCLTNPLAENDSQGLEENATQRRSPLMDNIVCLTGPHVEDDSQGLKENDTQDPVSCLTNPLAEDDSQGLEENTTQRRSPLMDNNVCLTDPHAEDDSQGLKENPTRQRSPSMDNIACITDPLVEDDIPGLKVKTNQQRSPSVDRTICLTGGLASVPNEMLETSANEGAEEADKLFVSNENINRTACQENPTRSLPDPSVIENGLHPGTDMVEISLNQDTEMRENKEVTSDEVICNDLPVDGNDEQQAAKRLRLSPPSGGEGELEVTGDEVICNDLPVDGNDEQQAAKRLRLTPPSGGEGELEVTSDEVICNDLPVDGNDEQQAAKRPRITSPAEGEGELTKSQSEDLQS